MQPKFSAYLDVVRFLAAFIVFVGHASGMNWTGGLFWQLGAYGDTCVVIFFVLSGFVIAYVVDNKENDWQVYGVNRIARLWSVVIPALVLTFVIDYFGVRMAPELYVGQPWFNGDHLGARYLASLFLVHEAWHISYAPGINQPFWSLGYEAFYYLIFGLLAFYKGRAKIALVAIVFLAGGPLVFAFFPIWMAGALAYQKRRAWKITPSAAALLFAVSLAMLAFSPAIRAAVSLKWMDQEITGRYVDAVAFFLNLVAAYNLLDRHGKVSWGMGPLIKRVAASTFVLYLFHRPLLQLFSYIGPDDAASWSRRALVLGGTVIVVVAATPLCERFQQRLRALLLQVFAGYVSSRQSAGTYQSMYIADDMQEEERVKTVE